MSTLDAATAVDLVRRIAGGETQAEAELVARCGKTLRFLTRRFTRDEADGEDLYQETLMLALEKIRQGEVREPERLAGFLRALAKNLKAGSTDVGDMMRIIPDGSTYRLQYRDADDGWKTLQELEYMPDTHTLENLTNEDGLPPLVPGHPDPERREPQRCITFWNCVARNKAHKCTIFAMRKGKNPHQTENDSLPFWDGPLDSENGSWGAEEEGGG